MVCMVPNVCGNFMPVWTHLSAELLESNGRVRSSLTCRVTCAGLRPRAHQERLARHVDEDAHVVNGLHKAMLVHLQVLPSNQGDVLPPSVSSSNLSTPMQRDE